MFASACREEWGGWCVSALRSCAYLCKADTVPMALADRWGLCVCGCVCVLWTPGTGGEGMGSYLEAGAPPSLPPLLPCSLTPPGGIWWEWLERPRPAGSASIPSWSVPDGALRDAQPLLRSPLAENQPALTALLQCWVPWWPPQPHAV